MLRAVADLDLRRVITFHSRVAGAREFADTLTTAAALLKDADRPERLTALAVAGTDRLKDRRAAFAPPARTANSPASSATAGS
ncbi:MULTISPECIES: hypothetical protein [unclassified Kitasatospora]|uniref:hypothetical protein n=1 Tax=unclassified Kitasatospora TaxID=2633591 RepID=UPI0033D3027A